MYRRRCAPYPHGPSCCPPGWSQAGRVFFRYRNGDRLFIPAVSLSDAADLRIDVRFRCFAFKPVRISDLLRFFETGSELPVSASDPSEVLLSDSHRHTVGFRLGQNDPSPALLRTPAQCFHPLHCWNRTRRFLPPLPELDTLLSSCAMLSEMPELSGKDTFSALRRQRGAAVRNGHEARKRISDTIVFILQNPPFFLHLFLLLCFLLCASR